MALSWRFQALDRCAIPTRDLLVQPGWPLHAFPGSLVWSVAHGMPNSHRAAAVLGVYFRAVSGRPKKADHGGDWGQQWSLFGSSFMDWLYGSQDYEEQECNVCYTPFWLNIFVAYMVLWMVSGEKREERRLMKEWDVYKTLVPGCYKVVSSSSLCH